MSNLGRLDYILRLLHAITQLRSDGNQGLLGVYYYPKNHSRYTTGDLPQSVKFNKKYKQFNITCVKF